VSLFGPWEGAFLRSKHYRPQRRKQKYEEKREGKEKKS
jgi:hypothetical protein